MLTQLSTVKARLGIAATEPSYDTLLTQAIEALGARFDRECNRVFGRTENATFEFPARQTEVSPPCYPIESVSKFELKTSEQEGWQLVDPSPAYLIRAGCVISLGQLPSSLNHQFSTCRLTYTGGYYLPDDPGYPLATLQYQLPPDLQQAVVEQITYWFQIRDKLGLVRYWPKDAAYEQFADPDLLPGTRAILTKYRRWS
ncbi:MAG TPA: hypothetical protein VG167_19545 [Verrucomicrobiae bacterium]|nr:hypothetical protein [Verrucomicrobiae bacterium]